jgi:hypothetical protein
VGTARPPRFARTAPPCSRSRPSRECLESPDSTVGTAIHAAFACRSICLPRDSPLPAGVPRARVDPSLSAPPPPLRRGAAPARAARAPPPRCRRTAPAAPRVCVLVVGSILLRARIPYYACTRVSIPVGSQGLDSEPGAAPCRAPAAARPAGRRLGAADSASGPRGPHRQRWNRRASSGSGGRRATAHGPPLDFSAP